MQIKRYVVRTINDAMVRIKKDLGPEAIVLSTRRVEEEAGGFLEVVAARDDKGIYDERDEMLTESPLCREKTTMARDWYGGHVETDIAEIKESLSTLFEMIGARKYRKHSPPLEKLFRYCVASGISSARASRLIEEMSTRPAVKSMTHFQEYLAEMGSIVKDELSQTYRKIGDTRITAFIGPTGVGKTTTLAKIAARISLEGKKRVGIITTDGYRIGAAEQLKKYADIMDVPFRIATSRKEIVASIASFSDRDVVLIDTPGKSPKDERFFSSLQSLLKGEHPVEKSLVLSMASGFENLKRTAQRFSTISYDTLVFTKLDEAVRYGSMYDIAVGRNVPVRYVTDGQDVPQDIETVDAEKFARLVVENRIH